jgi:protein-disulfide isomerase
MLFALANPACVSPKAMRAVQNDVKVIKETQEKDRTDLKVEIELIRGELLELKKAQQKQADELKRLSRRDPPPRPRANRPDSEVVYAVPVGDAQVRGASDAWVTIVEISDFQCPYCQRVQTTLNQLLDEYGNDLRLVFLHNPLAFHKRALPAAIAAECAAEQGKFWPMHDKLFDNYRALEEEDLPRYASGVPGLGMAEWSRCYQEKSPEKRIKKDQETAVRLGATGTPTFYINGRYLPGAQPIARFQELIDEELSKAKKSGIPRGAYYRQAVEEKGRDKP